MALSKPRLKIPVCCGTWLQEEQIECHFLPYNIQCVSLVLSFLTLVDGWKFGQLNGSMKSLCITSEWELASKMLTSAKAGMTLVPCFPSAGMVWAIQSVLPALPICTSFLMISCLNEVSSLSEHRRLNEVKWLSWSLNSPVVNQQSSLLSYFFLFSCNFHALLYNFLLFFFISLWISVSV